MLNTCEETEPKATHFSDSSGSEEEKMKSSSNMGMTGRKRRLRRKHKTSSWLKRWQPILIAMIFTAFFLWNLHYFKQRHERLSAFGTVRGGGNAAAHASQPWISTSSQPFNTNEVAVTAQNLIVVAGHSVTISGHLQDADRDESDWFLLDYQKNHGLPEAIVGHIKAGIQLATDDESSLLMFSGGQTRDRTGPETEGASYFRVADAMNLWMAVASNEENTVRARTITEEFARDSFENLLFSICRFFEITGSYPKQITLVSYTFKQRRFETLHVPALRWPVNSFSFVGVDPPPSTGFDLEASTKGEMVNAAQPFESDPYGCHSEVLKQKRKDRNPFLRTPPYGLSCPDMQDILAFCGPNLIEIGNVPWS